MSNADKILSELAHIRLEQKNHSKVIDALIDINAELIKQVERLSVLVDKDAHFELELQNGADDDDVNNCHNLIEPVTDFRSKIILKRLTPIDEQCSEARHKIHNRANFFLRNFLIFEQIIELRNRSFPMFEIFNANKDALRAVGLKSDEHVYGIILAARHNKLVVASLARTYKIDYELVNELRD